MITQKALRKALWT